MAADFTHLHVHSEYSLLDGLGKLDKLIERAKSFGMEALALTDHGAMYGSFKFYVKAKAAGIKPIIGVETYVARRSHLDKEGKIDTDPYHLVLLAKDELGYRNLLQLVTTAHLEGYYYKPRIDFELLSKHHEGLICLSGCLAGEVSQRILKEDYKGAKEVASRYAKLFGPKHYYIELQKHPAIPDVDAVGEKLVRLARELSLPLVATNDIHYVDPDDAEAQEILLCVQTQKTILEKDRPLSMLSSPDFYLRSPEEMKDLFVQYPEAIANTKRIADMCDLTLSVGKWILPKFPLPLGETPESYMRKLIEEKLPKKYPHFDKDMRQRLEYEMEIINSKGYTNYFLIVADFVNWAKDQGIAVGPGRGSAAGSMVTYVLNITGIDPLYFNLPFERFLNPYRPSAPDIDLDFADDRREEVIKYVTDRYGADHVASIITFGTMEAKGAVRDGGRALGMPYVGPDRISRMIPPGWQGHAMTIEKALEQSGELSLAYKTEPETKRLLDVAQKLEGVARHSSVHAAGIVIGDDPIVNHCPLQRESKGERIITQYDMYTVGEDGVGLLKMDFLGLRNLTIMSEALKFIKITQGITIDLETIPLDDKKTYSMLSEGETTGVFQLESAGMRRYIKELKPTAIFDLMAMVALYRPGPMQTIPEFIKRKHHPEFITFPDPRLEEVLKQSYGIIAYQDDVLLTAITVAGYSWGDADKLRKAVGKKIPAEMKKQQEKFTQGCIKNGMTKSKAEEMFHLIEPFAGYGFNKAHAACYAMIAYQTAYLKANFPVEYMNAVITAESRANTGPTRDEKISTIVAEIRRSGIPLKPPDINKSDVEFTIEDKTKIRFGLSAVKNVGSAAIDSILAARRAEGKFKSLTDLLSRVDNSKVNKKVLECLIKVGALAEFGSRAALLSVLPAISEQNQRLRKAASLGQVGLFEETLGVTDTKDTLPDLPEFSSRELLSFEKELLGFYFSVHPLDGAIDRLKDGNLTPLVEITSSSISQRVTIVGLVATVKKITTKATGAEMAFVKLEDAARSIEAVIFPKIYARTRELWVADTIVQVAGKIDEKEERLTILVDDARLVS